MEPASSTISQPSAPKAYLKPKARVMPHTLIAIPKRICTIPIASAMEKNLPWKSKKGTEGKYSARFIPKNEPQNPPKRIVAEAHSVANQAARRIMPGSRFFHSR